MIPRRVGPALVLSTLIVLTWLFLRPNTLVNAGLGSIHQPLFEVPSLDKSPPAKVQLGDPDVKYPPVDQPPLQQPYAEKPVAEKPATEKTKPADNAKPVENTKQTPPADDVAYDWATRKEQYPLKSGEIKALPSGTPVKMPKIQHAFQPLSEQRKVEMLRRRDEVKKTFERSWAGYKKQAWLKDELVPVDGKSKDRLGGWAVTLIDSLDTLWLMDMKSEFEEAVKAVGSIDFTKTPDEMINVFETTIRHLGGLLAAHDLTDGKYSVLLEKATQLGDMLYAAFDTENRMPIARWKWRLAKTSEKQVATSSLVGELGALSLEFTRLSQLTKNPKYYDAIQRVSDLFEKTQASTKLPGMWPAVVNPNDEHMGKDTFFSLGSMAGPLYEQFPKQHMLLGGLSKQPQKLYEKAIEVAKKTMFFKPMNKNSSDILIAGHLRVNTNQNLAETTLDAQGSHQACYIGGMMAMASKLFNRPDDMVVARKHTDGCIWSYSAIPTGIMPESFHVIPCGDPANCPWDESKFHALSMSRMLLGISNLDDHRYLLRADAIESLFIVYRITGEEYLLDKAWAMFGSIEVHTGTLYGNTALEDVAEGEPTKGNSMESYWMAETLKYFYLIFSDPSVMDLDEYVFNTQGHPFKRPVAAVA